MPIWLKLFLFALFFSLLAPGAPSAKPLAVIAPNQPTYDKPLGGDENKNATAKREKELEADMLLGLVDPFEYAGKDMDRPQMFAVRIFNPSEDGFSEERRDLLGDLEEIRHLDTKAWGANAALDKPGLYQFIMETKPWWDEEEGIFFRQQAKVIAPVLGVEEGWDRPVGQPLEITPLTRPFGLTAPALFSGVILKDGKPRAGSVVEMGYINSPKQKVPTDWHRVFKTKTDERGKFSFVLNRPGWWYCQVNAPASPLKGPDGQLKETQESSLLWLYVDAMDPLKTK
ncbi:MAG: DUF4198 domain-containing protein [Desulfovibrio sp.]|nr:DUF4198 domain-containing protein [Desulfovibrio sp.]